MTDTKLTDAVFRETDATFSLNSYEEDKLALISLFNQCTTEVNIYSHVLCPKIFDTKEMIEACDQFCLKSHRTKINILVKDSRPITRISHRLLGLSHRHSSSIFFKTINPRVHSREDDYVTFDKSAYFILPNYEHYSAVCNFSDAQRTTELLAFFNDTWDRSEPDTEFRSVLM